MRKSRRFPDVYKEDVDEKGDQWLISFSDMMTLLCAFFVLLLALSEINPVKLEIVSEAMNKALGGAQMAPRVSLSQIHSDLEHIVKEENLAGQVEVTRDRHGVALSLKGSSFFASGSTELIGQAVPFLAKIARQIKRVPYQIAIEGHTDDIPISSEIFPSNWELSTGRATRVVRLFIDLGISPNRLRAIGYAETIPIDPVIGNSTLEARARNRRVVVLFLDEIN